MDGGVLAFVVFDHEAGRSPGDSDSRFGLLHVGPMLCCFNFGRFEIGNSGLILGLSRRLTTAGLAGALSPDRADPWPTKTPVSVAAAGTAIREVDTIGQVRTLPVIDGEVTLMLNGAPRIFYGLLARQDDDGRHTLAGTTP